jgi:thiamine transport system permease protein
VNTSLLQALVSSLATLLVAAPSAWGLMALKRSLSPFIFLMLEFLLLTPSFLPPLIVMVSVLSVFHFFPFGFWGVVGMHTLFELGLVSVFLSRCFYKRIEPYEVLLALHRKSVVQNILLIVGLCRRDLLMMFGMLFVFFFTSLSIPIIMSGGGFSSLEYTMYTQFKNSNDWQAILPLYVIQIGIIGFVLLINVKIQTEEIFLERRSAFLKTKGAALSLLSLIPPIVIFIGLISQLSKGFLSAQREGLEFFNSIVGTLLIGFSSSTLIFFFLSVLAYFYQTQRYRKYLQLWTIPSFAVIAFLFQTFCKTDSIISYFYLAATLTYLFVPTIAKLGMYQQIESLHPQIEMAHVLGASFSKIFLTITFPVLLPWIAVLSSLAGLWSMGDFAISRLFLVSDLTLGLKIQSLIGQYRWDQALFLSWILLLGCFSVFLFFGGLAYVAYQKLK